MNADMRRIVLLPIFLVLVILVYTGLGSVYVVILLDVLLIAFLMGYYVPGVKRVKKRELQGELRKKVEELKRRMGVAPEVYIVGNVRVMQAYQVGSRGRYVLLTKLLIDRLEMNELLAIVAHEFAHIKRRHVLKKMIIFYGLSGLGINAMILAPLLSIPESAVQSIQMMGLAIIILCSPIEMLIRIRYDMEADSIAARFVGSTNMIAALKSINSFIYPQFMVEQGKIHTVLRKRIKYLGG